MSYGLHHKGWGISIHALREEGDPATLPNLVEQHTISIHALREEGDQRGSVSHWNGWTFLSTPSARRATAVHQICKSIHLISIHALREEGDF